MFTLGLWGHHNLYYTVNPDPVRKAQAVYRYSISTVPSLNDYWLRDVLGLIGFTFCQLELHPSTSGHVLHQPSFQTQTSPVILEELELTSLNFPLNPADLAALPAVEGGLHGMCHGGIKSLPRSRFISCDCTKRKPREDMCPLLKSTCTLTRWGFCSLPTLIYISLPVSVREGVDSEKEASDSLVSFNVLFTGSDRKRLHVQHWVVNVVSW